MPDPNVQLSTDEQSYFDTKGETEVKNVEQVIEQPKVEEKPAVAKQIKKVGKTSKETSEIVETPETTSEVITKTPDQEKAENLEAALREERRTRAENERKTDERLRLLQTVIEQKQQTPTQPQEAIPDVEKDPLGTLKFLFKEVREGKQNKQLNTQQVEERQHNQRIMGEAGRMEMEFLAQQPDYDVTTKQSASYNDASSFLVNMRKAELAATGAYNPMQINELIASEAINLAKQAIQGGRNPAQVVLDIAKARGFKTSPKQVTETEAEKISRIAKGQEAGFSLSQASGSKGPVNKGMDAKTLATMSEDDFTNFLEKAKKSELKELFGN